MMTAKQIWKRDFGQRRQSARMASFVAWKLSPSIQAAVALHAQITAEVEPIRIALRNAEMSVFEKRGWQPERKELAPWEVEGWQAAGFEVPA